MSDIVNAVTSDVDDLSKEVNYSQDNFMLTVELFEGENSDPFTIDPIETFSTHSILLVAIHAIKAGTIIEKYKPFLNKITNPPISFRLGWEGEKQHSNSGLIH